MTGPASCPFLAEEMDELDGHLDRHVAAVDHEAVREVPESGCAHRRADAKLKSARPREDERFDHQG